MLNKIKYQIELELDGDIAKSIEYGRKLVEGAYANLDSYVADSLTVTKADYSYTNSGSFITKEDDDNDVEGQG